MAKHTQTRLFPYVPNFIPGELLYAWVSRLHVVNGLPNPQSTLSILFGSHASVLSGDLPSGLVHFCSQTKEWGPFSSAKEVACNATLYPYFARFMPERRRQLLLDNMCAADGNGVKAAAGLLANGFGATVLLKSCHRCDATCEEDFGCKTWFRVHQLPGVSICPVHGCSLKLHVVQSGQANRHALLISHSEVAHDASVSSALCAERFALLSDQALHCSAPRLADEERTRRYRAGIAKLGLGTGGKIHWEALAQLVGDHYDWFAGMYCQDRLLSSLRQPLRWLRDLCQRPEKNMHPICHMLLAGFLYGDLESFFSQMGNHCAACISTSSNSPMSSRMKTDTDYRLNRLLHDQSLSCREVARQSGRSVHCIISKRLAMNLPVSRRPKMLTLGKEEKILRLANRGDTAAGISKEMHLSLATTYRVLANNGVRIQSTGSAEHRARNEWLALLQLHPDASRTSLRRLHPSVYIWLYRHDREWLGQHVPDRLKPKSLGTTRVDWPVRDTFFAGLIRDVATQARTKSKGKRISASFLLRSTGHEKMIRCNYSKLPQILIALRDCVENDASFRKRRLQYAKRLLIEEGIIEPPEWMVNKRSGIRILKP